MLLNERKSGIVQFGLRTRKPKTNSISGIPWLTEYTYLGGVMQSNQKLDHHSIKINPKIGWITSRLTPFRMLGNLRLNINLFKLFLAPLLYQCAESFLRTDKIARKKYKTFYRGALKRFINIPRTTSTEVLELMYNCPAVLMESQFLSCVKRAA